MSLSYSANPGPTVVPTKVPTKVPSSKPTFRPSVKPSLSPTLTPTISKYPSRVPTFSPTVAPTNSKYPTRTPSSAPVIIPAVSNQIASTNSDIEYPINELCILMGLLIFFMIVCCWDIVGLMLCCQCSHDGYQNGFDRIIQRQEKYVSLYIIFELFGLSVSIATFLSMNDYNGSDYQYVVVIAAFTLLSALYGLWLLYEYNYRRNIKVFTYRTDILKFLISFSLNFIAFVIALNLALVNNLNQPLLASIVYNFTSIVISLSVFFCHIIGKGYYGVEPTIKNDITISNRSFQHANPVSNKAILKTRSKSQSINLGFNSEFADQDLDQRNTDHI